jgi:AcrR family transcriptional regulator
MKAKRRVHEQPLLAPERNDPPQPGSELRGVAPIHQARSEATYQALIAAGRKALENQSFEQMTVANLARSAGASVGAFYGRFDNKRAFFSAIQETVVAEVEAHVRAQLDALDIAGADARTFLCVIAEIWACIFRDNKGLYRAAFKDSSAAPHVWTPFKRLGWHAAAMVSAKLLPRLSKMGAHSTERDVRIAMQFMNGMLVNATINDPGPIHLESDEMVPYLKRLLCAFLGLDVLGTADAGCSRDVKPLPARTASRARTASPHHE